MSAFWLCAEATPYIVTDILTIQPGVSKSSIFLAFAAKASWSFFLTASAMSFMSMTRQRPVSVKALFRRSTRLLKLAFG